MVGIGKDHAINTKTNIVEHHLPEIKDFTNIELVLMDAVLQLRNHVLPSK